ncbi:fatty acid oxidation complex subunit alpha FadJ [Algicola sagamiensis]|uniref:fatty acid oxidation complex subunit alpha FadJ n=1 Tax=Algicola sagamiensis TaxID=163869 RepID=UPI0003774C5B|nr:fatty acid oxidation complex subunit alpha FadJ [Algicola sagamiensis]
MTAKKKSAFSLEIRDDNIGVITMDVPGEKMNTLKSEFADQFVEIMDKIKHEPNLKGLVLISGKDDSFVAGADISMLDSCKSQNDAEEISRTAQRVFKDLETLKVPIIAAINGPCLGGGLELALACHARICTTNPKTAIGLPEVQLGLLPGGGGTQRLPRLVGVQKALDMMLTGKQIRPKQAKKMGLVDDIVPKTILLDAAIKLAKKGKPSRKPPKLDLMGKVLETNPYGRKVLFDQATKQTLKKTRGNYPAPEKILDAVKAGVELGIEQGYDKEAKGFSELVMTKESEALRSIFFATTEMKKENGVDGVDPLKVNKAAVLGGGLMGGGISYVTTNKASVPVRLKDISHDGIKHAMQYSFDLLNKKVKRRHILKAEMQKQMNMLTGTVDYSGFHDADIVMEAVFEDLNLKRRMVADVEENCRENTIFASNTSSLPIGQIAGEAKRPENVIGLHYFSPVDKMPLVEVIAHDKTSDSTISTTVDFARKQGKTPIVVKDKAGFYVNRILAPYMNEAAFVLLDGEPIEHLDSALVDFGFPVGPMTLLDEVGIDIGAKIGPILVGELGDRFQAPAAFDKLIADGRKGKKNGKGLYLYNGKAKKSKKEVDESVYALLGITPNQKQSKDEIAERCVVQMLNEAARCLDEGIIRNARDGDIGAIFGIGFPPFLGGPFRYMDQLGAKQLVSKLEGYQRRYGDRFEPADCLKNMAEKDGKFYQDA